MKERENQFWVGGQPGSGEEAVMVHSRNTTGA